MLTAALGLGCGGSSDSTPAPPPTGPAPAPAAAVFGANDPLDVPLAGLTADERTAFHEGDRLFGLVLRDNDGLGPIYVRSSCSACHTEGVRGPGLVQKMAVVAADGFTPATDQSLVPYGSSVRPLLAGGGRTPLVPPNDPSVKVTTRLGPPVLGRGYMEAIADAEIERVAAEQAAQGGLISGRVNYVTYTSQPNPDARFHAHKPGDRVIGRFGLKARIASLDDFTADALAGDMGITNPLRPTELPNPDGLTDDAKPGVDVAIDSVNLRTMYVRLLAIPKRTATMDVGAQRFAEVGCATCHVPSLRTRADYPVPALANIDAPVYTDMLLHDLGDELADGLVEGDASSREWRTSPLIGLRFDTSYMHDGRAKSIAEAIAAHAGRGSEAVGVVGAYNALSPQDQAALIDFVSGL